MNSQTLTQEILPFLSHYGLIIVFLGALIEGETVIILSGVLCLHGTLPFYWTVAIAALGAFAGDQFWFYLGRRYGLKVLLHFPYLAKYADKVRPLLREKSDWIALSNRFVYGTRTIAPIMLGMEKYPINRFISINIFSASLWATLGVGAGYLVGTGVEKLFGKIEHIEQLLLAIVVIMIIWWYWRRKFSATTDK